MRSFRMVVKMMMSSFLICFVRTDTGFRSRLLRNARTRQLWRSTRNRYEANAPNLNPTHFVKKSIDLNIVYNDIFNTEFRDFNFLWFRENPVVLPHCLPSISFWFLFSKIASEHPLCKWCAPPKRYDNSHLCHRINASPVHGTSPGSQIVASRCISQSFRTTNQDFASGCRNKNHKGCCSRNALGAAFPQQIC